MIQILNANQFLKTVKAKGPVKSSQFFLGKSHNPHPDGLFSEDIFGIDGSPEFKTSFSYVELNSPVIHPVLYDILCKRIERKIESLLSGEASFSLNEEGHLVDDPNGPITGMSSLYEHRYKWKFRRNVTEEGEAEGNRNKIIDMLEGNLKDDLFFLTKLLIIPPAFRPIVILEEDKPRMDPLNEIYQKAIILSNQLSSVSGTLFDILAYRMQNLMRDLHDYARTKIAKKSGMIRKLMLGKRVDFSARTVISPNPKMKLGEVGIPIRMICQLFEPNILYGLVNSPYADNIPAEFHEEVKKFLGKESAYEMGF